MNTDFSILKILLLLRFWGNADADISKVPTQHFRRKNASFCVKVGDAPPYDIRLAFNNTLVVNSNKTTEAYKHRVNYTEKNIELCLHNLSESDSGIYKLSVVKNGKIDDKEFHLVVQDVVPRPVIQMSAHSNLSADLCLITVKCSVWEDWVLSVCNESVCLTSERSLRTVNLTVSAGYRSVFCIGRNDVSASNISEKICFTDTPRQEPQLYIYAGLLGLPVILSAILLWIAKKPTSPSIKQQREACPPQIIRPAGAESRGSVSLSQSEVTYENITEEQSTQNHMLDSVNGVLQGPNGSAGDGGGAEEPKSPLEVETVYSVLQKVQSCCEDLGRSRQILKKESQM